MYRRRSGTTGHGTAHDSARCHLSADERVASCNSRWNRIVQFPGVASAGLHIQAAYRVPSTPPVSPACVRVLLCPKSWFPTSASTRTRVCSGCMHTARHTSAGECMSVMHRVINTADPLQAEPCALLPVSRSWTPCLRRPVRVMPSSCAARLLKDPAKALFAW